MATQLEELKFILDNSSVEDAEHRLTKLLKESEKAPLADGTISRDVWSSFQSMLFEFRRFDSALQELRELIDEAEELA